MLYLPIHLVDFETIVARYHYQHASHHQHCENGKCVKLLGTFATSMGAPLTWSVQLCHPREGGRMHVVMYVDSGLQVTVPVY